MEQHRSAFYLYMRIWETITYSSPQNLTVENHLIKSKECNADPPLPAVFSSTFSFVSLERIAYQKLDFDYNYNALSPYACTIYLRWRKSSK